MQSLRGKTAIVTGASKGIGAAAAAHLAREGVSVVLAARSEAAITEQAAAINRDGGRALAHRCDVAVYADFVALAELCRAEFGSVDILINNAGLIDPIAKLAESDPEQWVTAADVNYKGVYYGMRAAIPVMLEQAAGGVIVNISSGAATGALEGWSHYCSSKAAALSLTRCGHREYADTGIRVVGLSPGTVATDMQVSIKASGINPVSQFDPSVHIPVAWAAQAIAWLCTDDAKEFDGSDFSLRPEENRRRAGLPV